MDHAYAVPGPQTERVWSRRSGVRQRTQLIDDEDTLVVADTVDDPPRPSHFSVDISDLFTEDHAAFSMDVVPSSDRRSTGWLVFGAMLCVTAGGLLALITL